MMRLSLKWPLFSAMLCVLAFLLLLTTKSISAQTTSLGTIAGVVTDPTNAVVPDATVTIKDTATAEERTTNSNVPDATSLSTYTLAFTTSLLPSRVSPRFRFPATWWNSASYQPTTSR